MRKLISLFLIIFFITTLTTTQANAKRFGGGRSFGMQRSSQTFSRNSVGNLGQTMRQGANRWMAPLMGLALGSLIGSLLFSNGVSSAFLSWLAVGGAIFLLLTLVRRFFGKSSKPIYHYQGISNQQNMQHVDPNNFSGTTRNGFNQPNINREDLLRAAKALFIRMQTAYDKKDLNDLRKFTTPEVFAEIQLQLQERGEAANQTDVLTLNAKLLEVNNNTQITLRGETLVTSASVSFDGIIREDQHIDPISFNETWYLQKDTMSNDWQVAGIQQVLNH